MERNLRKQMLIAAGVIVGVLLTLLILIGVLTRLSESLGEDPQITNENGESVTIEFSTEYITDEDKLLLDDRYQGYDRTVYFQDERYGLTVGLDAATASDYGPAVELLYLLVGAAMSGDHELYNACFSETYFASNDPQEEFSMQKLYDIRITRIDESKPDGKSYTEYLYALDYKIRRNNGSLRPDIDSDGSKTQYILITDRDGSLLIDRILTQ